MIQYGGSSPLENIHYPPPASSLDLQLLCIWSIHLMEAKWQYRLLRWFQQRNTNWNEKCCCFHKNNLFSKFIFHNEQSFYYIDLSSDLHIFFLSQIRLNNFCWLSVQLFVKCQNLFSKKNWDAAKEIADSG